MYLGLRFTRDREDLLVRADEEEYREFRKIQSNVSRDGSRKKE
jgi:hypothetical protein